MTGYETIHKAAPFPRWAEQTLGTACRHCGRQIRQSVGGSGMVWVHLLANGNPGHIVGSGPDLADGAVFEPLESECRHCHRRIVNDSQDGWVDPEADGDDVMWRETCDAHDTFEARHEPAIAPSSPGGIRMRTCVVCGIEGIPDTDLKWQRVGTWVCDDQKACVDRFTSGSRPA